ncbi:hypothetical protein [Plasticicumulans sp.]|uniref:hypothetical protein n=1 Tax=Plasticicumulans sp. TaxID=2307179 RepID=UPI003954190A
MKSWIEARERFWEQYRAALPTDTDQAVDAWRSLRAQHLALWEKLVHDTLAGQTAWVDRLFAQLSNAPAPERVVEFRGQFEQGIRQWLETQDRLWGELFTLMRGEAPVAVDVPVAPEAPAAEPAPVEPVSQAPAEPVYEQPAPVYEQQAPVYEQPAPVYEQQAPVYEQQAPVYEQPAPVYEQQAPVYEQQAPVYEQQAPVYEQQAPVYEQPAPVYEPMPSEPVADDTVADAGESQGEGGDSAPKTRRRRTSK